MSKKEIAIQVGQVRLSMNLERRDSYSAESCLACLWLRIASLPCDIACVFPPLPSFSPTFLAPSASPNPYFSRFTIAGTLRLETTNILVGSILCIDQSLRAAGACLPHTHNLCSSMSCTLCSSNHTDSPSQTTCPHP